LLLNDQLKRLSDRTTLGRIGQCNRVEEALIRQIDPFCGRCRHLQPFQTVRVVAYPEIRKTDADPAPLRIPVRLTPKRARNGEIAHSAEKLGELAEHPAVDQKPPIGHIDKIKTTSPEQQIDIASDIRMKKSEASTFSV
jgi:hypothetical protein